MKRQLVITGDGSHTLFASDLQDHYHSTFGAVQESNHIYIESALKAHPSNRKMVNVLEIGFGTGLNALLTWQQSYLQKMKIQYVTIEPHPVELAMALRLNYPDFIDIQDSVSIFKKLHQAAWGEGVVISEYMRFTKMDTAIQEASLEPMRFDIVYFDAFGPEAQPELWTVPVFQKIYDSMALDSVMTTFSSKGSVKRAMQEAGFNIELLDGPPGKRTITRAWKK